MAKFELWSNGTNTVLVYFYELNGEGHAQWTDHDKLPANEDEEKEWLENLDWGVENMTFLRKNGYKPLEPVKKTLRIWPDLNRRIKFAAIDMGISENDLMERAIVEYLNASKKASR